ncbi:MAG TPA: non-canonical purine NTP pyrophosphatase, partial [Actinomycetota bacterium]|nr:non-canonical purine NTP pyrophosphatase [Actinomycetota bacterium]
DDSGIEVDNLGGAPGVRSAYFGGPDATDEENNARLIEALDGVPVAKRTARYRCVAVVVDPSGRSVEAEATCEGRIAEEPRGSGGFGYDPWFIPQGESRHMAELTLEEKQVISHRGRALRALIPLIQTLLVEKR